MVAPSTFPMVRETGISPKRFPWRQTLKDVVVGLGQAVSLVPMSKDKSDLPEGTILVKTRDGWVVYKPKQSPSE